MQPGWPSLKQIIPPLLILGVLAVLMWAPWVTAPFAEQRAEAAFTASWQGVVDGCGLNCSGCGAEAVKKTLLGYQVALTYACGMLPEDSPAYHQRAAGFVSFLGTVHGLPRP